jgi:hypothetical protein
MEETEPGIFEASIGADAAGLYRFRVRGEGETLRGHRFTREWELTGSVWHRGDDPYPSARNDPTARSEQFCETLLCLAESFEEYFEERGVDTDRVRECLERYCESVRGSPESEEPGRSDFGRLGGGLTTTGGDGAGYRPSGSAADPELIEALDVLMRRVGGS